MDWLAVAVQVDVVMEPPLQWVNVRGCLNCVFVGVCT